ncbi:MAG TPA: SpoIIE family protein phosphatase [Terriglobales bacterium]|nr:SpoIIE family protein phosphatase [Terriglobales bacterium]
MKLFRRTRRPDSEHGSHRLLARFAAGLSFLSLRLKRDHQPSPAEQILGAVPSLDLAQAVRRATSVEDLFQSLIRTVNATFPSKAVSLFIRDDETGNYPCRISTIPGEGDGSTPALARDAFVVRRLRGLDSPFSVDAGDLKAWADALQDAPREVFEKRMRERETLERTRTSLLVQLKTRNELIGILCLGESNYGRFSPRDQQALKGVAGQLALIIENAKLLERLVEHQRLQAELELAAEVQRSLLPHRAPTMRDFDLCGFCKPAQQVGGDYYDFVSVGEHSTGIAIADVAGKGISAALLMSVVQASLRGQLLGSNGTHSLGEMVGLLNRLISGSVSTARYVTFFYAQLDQRQNGVRFVNAGHNPPILYSAATAEFQMLDSSGPVLGVLPEANFTEQACALNTGDVLFAYTDGVTEALNSSGEEFGEERLRAAIAAACSGSAQDILDRVIAEVTAWSSGIRQHDDITVIALKKN